VVEAIEDRTDLVVVRPLVRGGPGGLDERGRCVPSDAPRIRYAIHVEGGSCTARSGDDYIGAGSALTFIEAMLRAQPWVEDAATVVRCVEVCRTCPVKCECSIPSRCGCQLLRDLRRHDPHRAASGVPRTLAGDSTGPEFRMPSWMKEGVTAGVSGPSLAPSDRNPIAAHLGDMLDATFEKRSSNEPGRPTATTLPTSVRLRTVQRFQLP
jgi:hypothetical protein